MRTEAYRSVVVHKTFSKLQDLNRKYTYKSMRHGIQDTLDKMDPAFIRAQKSKLEVEKARRIQQEVMQNNIETARANFRHEAIQEAIERSRRLKERSDWEKVS
jgi:hypothetical protein